MSAAAGAAKPAGEREGEAVKPLRERHSHGDRSFPFEIFDQRARGLQQICYLHWHDEAEWIYVAEGAVDVMVDGAAHRVGAGQMFAVDSRVLHQVIAVEDCRQFACTFDKRLLAFALADFVSWQYLNPYIEGKTTVAGPVTCADSALGDAFAQMARDCAEKPACFQLDVKLNLLRIFELVVQGGYLVERRAGAHELEPVEVVLSYIEGHYAEKVTSAQLAALVGYNPQYFSRYFKRNTGLAPTEYVNRFRIERACEQLLDPERSILDISVACGFQSASYFIKKFKELKGMPPKRYRALLQDNTVNWSEYYSTVGPEL